ncbi:NTP transferase domain-containing protein [Candidatus Saccharibacteria bacterium]|nr:NTP transferase domain-containing protein [Candidatus Saccharibacteria bacterium]
MSETRKVTKAVIAAAGFGTRFLPQTKAMPKEMLPLIDKPIIQYVVEQLVEAGIQDIIIVSNYSKRAIEDHFDAPNQDLVANLLAGGPKKQHYLDEINEIANLANFAFVRQKGPYGSATPITNAAHLIGDEPFIYTYADDLITASPNRFKQMIDLYEELGGSIFPCIEISSEEEFDRYGVVAGRAINENTIAMEKLVEKPGKAAAPSNFASVGGYLLTPELFPYLDTARNMLTEGEEFYLTTYVLEPMIRDGKQFFGCKLNESHYYDTGNKLEYLKTVFDFAMARPDIQPELEAYLRKKLQ